jgi:apolipoprotein N-acyltransferase
MLKALRPLAAAALSGVLLYLTAPPLNLAWLAWFLWVPLLVALDGLSLRRGMAVAYFGGWVAQAVIYSWLVDTVVIFSSLPWLVAVAVLLLFATAFSGHFALMFGAAGWLRRRLGPAWILAVPVIVVGVERAFPQLFPYYQGATQYRHPYVWQLVSVLGVWGVSFLVMMTNCALAELVLRWREKRRPPVLLIAGVAAAFVGNLGFGAWRYAHVESVLQEAPVVDMAFLQQNVSMEERLQGSALDGLRAWIDLTRRVEIEEPDLVVWPEGSVAFNPNSEKVAKVLGERSPRKYFEDLSEHGGFDFLVGGGTIEALDEPDEYGRHFRAFNSTYFFKNDGGLSDRYDKMVPLPFGEYIPLSDTFPFLKGIIKGPGDFQKGKRPTTFVGTTRAGTPYRFTVPICYEAILDSTMRVLLRGDDFAENGPVDLFVVITNDGWFGDTASPHQHAMLTTTFATALGRPLARHAYTGVSWVVEPHGEIAFETDTFTEVVETVEVRMGSFSTLYAAGGWVFPWLCTLGGLVIVFVARRRGEPA